MTNREAKRQLKIFRENEMLHRSILDDFLAGIHITGIDLIVSLSNRIQAYSELMDHILRSELDRLREYDKLNEKAVDDTKRSVQ
jgi:hypothetical protein